MFRKNASTPRNTPGKSISPPSTPIDRVTSVLGTGIIWKGNLLGEGGVRIEGAFEGEIILRGLVIIGETGRVTCEMLRATNVIVIGTVNGKIMAEKLDIRASGRVWGDVIVEKLTTEDGAFLRGQVRMEEHVEIPVEFESSSEETSLPQEE